MWVLLTFHAVSFRFQVMLTHLCPKHIYQTGIFQGNQYLRTGIRGFFMQDMGKSASYSISHNVYCPKALEGGFLHSTLNKLVIKYALFGIYSELNPNSESLILK